MMMRMRMVLLTTLKVTVVSFSVLLHFVPVLELTTMKMRTRLGVEVEVVMKPYLLLVEALVEGEGA